MSRSRKLADDAILHVLLRIWIKVIQLEDWSKGRRCNTRFRKISKGRYALDIQVPTEADVVGGVAQVGATGSITAISDFLVAREKRIRELGRR